MSQAAAPISTGQKRKRSLAAVAKEEEVRASKKKWGSPEAKLFASLLIDKKAVVAKGMPDSKRALYAAIVPILAAEFPDIKGDFTVTRLEQRVKTMHRLHTEVKKHNNTSGNAPYNTYAQDELNAQLFDGCHQSHPGNTLDSAKPYGLRPPSGSDSEGMLSASSGDASLGAHD